jgi:hypothetical protein
MAIPVFVLMWYSTPWTSDVVLNFLFLCLSGQKSATPAFGRLTDGGWPSLLLGFFCISSLVKLLFLYTWTTIDSQPARPSTFFTVAFPADVTGVECGLVC